jgi:hypothetical protein
VFERERSELLIDITMEQMCKNDYCRKNLKEYRELTSKLYDDIDGLESDLKDKDVFLQTVVKARNAYQNEVANLKKKNLELIKENNDLLEKNEQLDEDAETGLSMVKNAHERERKLNTELNDCRGISNKNVEKLSEIEKDNKDLNTKLDFVKEKLGKCLKENQEMSIFRENRIKELEEEILAFKERTEKVEHDRNYSALDAEIKLKEQEAALELLRIENEKLKQKSNDLIDELLVKKKEVLDLEENNEKTKLKNSSSSLKDELQQIEMFECETCSLNFETHLELRKHIKTLHSEKLNLRIVSLSKLNTMEVKLSEQKIKLTSSLLELKNKEVKERLNCRCKGYCRIYHEKHNFVKFKSDELIERLKIFSEINLIGKSPKDTFLGAFKKCYTCNKCEETFPKQGDLKRHKKTKHNSRREEIGEVE